MTKTVLGCAVLVVCGMAARAELNMDWAYHDDNDSTDDRTVEYVPAKGHAFIENGSVSVPDGDKITLYVLTVNQFAGDADEQVFVRWWNGNEEHWVMGSWVENVFLGSGENDAGRFHGLPAEAPVMLDLWKIEITPEMTRPGENYYVIQLKGFAEGGSTEAYLLRDSSEDSRNNNVNQAWSPSGYFGHDWSVMVTE